eukprot:PhF_6_TR35384/c0_g1_i1/m.51433
MEWKTLGDPTLLIQHSRRLLAKYKLRCLWFVIVFMMYYGYTANGTIHVVPKVEQEPLRQVRQPSDEDDVFAENETNNNKTMLYLHRLQNAYQHAPIREYYQQHVNYRRRALPHVTAGQHHWALKFYNDTTNDHSNVSLLSLSILAVGKQPLDAPFSFVTDSGTERAFSVLVQLTKGLEPCYSKRFNFFARYSVTLPLPGASFQNEIVLLRNYPIFIVEALAVTVKGTILSLRNAAAIQEEGPVRLSRSMCVIPRYPNLNTRELVLKSLNTSFLRRGGEEEGDNAGGVPAGMLRHKKLKIPLEKDCVILTAAIGSLESCLHRVFPVTPTKSKYERRCVALVFTDQPELEVHPDWTVIRTPYHLSDARLLRSSSMARGKYYKMQAYKLLPSHIRYLMWYDATIEVLNATVVDTWFDRLERDSSMHIITAPYYERKYLLGEACDSFNKYMSIYPNIVNDYLAAVKDGFCEGYWKSGGGEPFHVHDLAVLATSAYCEDPSHAGFSPLRWGYRIAQRALGRKPTCKSNFYNVSAETAQRMHAAYITCIVLMDLRAEKMRDFLDYWYESTARHQQDQVSFSIALWRFGLVPGSVAFDVQGSNGVLRKHRHGKKGCGADAPSPSIFTVFVHEITDETRLRDALVKRSLYQYVHPFVV